MAVLSLGKVRAEGKVAAAAWMRALQDSDRIVRQSVPDALQAYYTRGPEIGGPLSSPEQLVPAEHFFEDLIASAEVLRKCLAGSDEKSVLRTLQAMEALLDTVEKTPELEGRNIDPLVITEAVTEPLRKALVQSAQVLAGLLPMVVQVIQQPPTENQRQAALVLEKIAQLCDPRPELLERREGGPRVRGRMMRRDFGAEGAEALATMKAALKSATAGIIPIVGHPPICVQLAVLDTLEALGPTASAAVPEVRKLLRNHDRFVRWAAARTLSAIGPIDDNLPTVLGLAELVRDEDLDVASSACQFLGDVFAKEAGPAVPALSCAAMSEERELQYAAVLALADVVRAIKAEAGEAVPGLIVALQSSDLKTRQAVPPILGELRAAARPALPALQKALDDENLEVRLEAAKAILRIMNP